MKEESGQPWFELENLMKIEKACGFVYYWIKAILHNWNALTEMLKTEKKMSDSDIDDINRLDNYI